MRDERKLVFKVATEQEELDRIHELNYRTFVEEIPQHAPNQERMLVDKFHSENTYVICKRGDELLGMVAVVVMITGRRLELNWYRINPMHVLVSALVVFLGSWVFKIVVVLLARRTPALGT